MKHTLEELQAKTDAEIIELCATEVMGWEPCLEHDEWWLYKQDHVASKDWNPLTDWNHTIALITALRSKGFNCFLTFPAALTTGASFLCCRESPSSTTSQLENDPQRAICLAALLTIPT
jgi:hypothetical protein